MMLRTVASRGVSSRWVRRTEVSSAASRLASTGKSALEADTGPWATRVHHASTVLLGVAAPAYLLAPDGLIDGALGKAVGVALSANIAFHSWIGLNYVAADYVPKVSKALLPPARVVIAGMAAVTFLGMAKAAVWSPGGLKAIVKGPWTGKTKELEF